MPGARAGRRTLARLALCAGVLAVCLLVMEIGALCADLGIPLIDPLPELRAAVKPGGERLYYPKDRHLTRPGHEIVARVLARELQP
jgi:hypothetical protein